jgi:molybdate transport system substrate-binding protein
LRKGFIPVHFSTEQITPRRLAAVIATLLVSLLVAGVAGAQAGRQAATRVSGITVYAAASLTDVFPQIDKGPKYSFGASSTLAAQITQGAPADVFASANTTIPDQLFAKGLVRKPVVFTRNRLVLVVPTSNPAGIHSVYDLKKPGIKLVIAAPAVPVGSYTLQVLKQMALTSVLSNVVSRESDVRSVLSKVALGEADAGFVYSTDAKTVPGKVNVIKIPAWAQPKVTYELAVVSSSPNEVAAQAFVKEVLSKAGQKKMLAAGFLPVPTTKSGY